MRILRSREKMRAAALGLLAALMLAGCGQREESAKPPAGAPLPSAVQAAVVEARLEAVPVRLELTGRVAAVTQAVLSSQIRAVIEAVLVHEGVSVAKGQVLVTMDNRDLRAHLSRAEAELENARKHLARMEGLLVEQAVSRQEVEDANRAFKVAEAERRTAAVQLSHTIVKAPFDGVITEKQVEAGELAVPGQPLVGLEDSRHLRLETTVAEGDLSVISRGMTIPVTIDALGQASLQGKVAQILPAGDPRTHTFLIKIALPGTAGLRTGMFGRIQLDKGTNPTIVVPLTSVFERGQLTGVYVVGADRIARLRWVKVGRRLENRQEVLSGLNVSEHILLEAGKGSDGLPIQPS
jgi:RND family efflux transporter MFP subunit